MRTSKNESGESKELLSLKEIKRRAENAIANHKAFLKATIVLLQEFLSVVRAERKRIGKDYAALDPESELALGARLMDGCMAELQVRASTCLSAGEAALSAPEDDLASLRLGRAARDLSEQHSGIRGMMASRVQSGHWGDIEARAPGLLGRVLDAMRPFEYGAEPEDESEVGPDDTLVTLDQAGAVAGLSKRKLERMKQKGELPKPRRKGGGGKSAWWAWSELRVALARDSRAPLPARFPGTPS